MTSCQESMSRKVLFPAVDLCYSELNIFKYSCSSAISTLAGKENKRRLQTLSIDNAWSNKNFLVYLTFRMLQHTSSEVNGYNCYKHLKIQK